MKTKCAKTCAKPKTKDLRRRRKSLLINSGRWDSNPRRPAWEAGILPLNYARTLNTRYYQGLREPVKSR
jgi:hypothetical protein